MIKAWVVAGDYEDVANIMVGGDKGGVQVDSVYEVKIGEEFAGRTITRDMIGQSFELPEENG